MARLNLEFFPASTMTVITLGDVRLVQGDTAAAIAEYRRAAGMDNGRLSRQRLRALGQP